VTGAAILFAFRQPTEQTRKRLEDAVADLSVAAEFEREPREASVVGTLSEVVDAVDGFLHRDAEQNALESRGEPWLYDYVVRRDPGGSLQVMTRLTSPTKSGEIFYGCTVARLPDGRYMAWIDE